MSTFTLHVSLEGPSLAKPDFPQHGIGMILKVPLTYIIGRSVDLRWCACVFLVLGVVV